MVLFDRPNGKDLRCIYTCPNNFYPYMSILLDHLISRCPGRRGRIGVKLEVSPNQVIRHEDIEGSNLREEAHLWKYLLDDLPDGKVSNF